HYIPTAQQSEHLLRRIHSRTGTTTAALLHRQHILHNRTHRLLHLLRGDQAICGANRFPKLGIDSSDQPVRSSKLFLRMVPSSWVAAAPFDGVLVVWHEQA